SAAWPPRRCSSRRSRGRAHPCGSCRPGTGSSWPPAPLTPDDERVSNLMDLLRLPGDIRGDLQRLLLDGQQESGNLVHRRQLDLPLGVAEQRDRTNIVAVKELLVSLRDQ